ncbi:hypothetical protein L3V82_02050 [Thiotrichales bacterium 19S3-7]|nr:hypothetical protein [Thiotrichales bacterium 19S3-7]MCF6800948.1 hypothetical protein [Thiotrichales bacterium 19S3-11]
MTLTKENFPKITSEEYTDLTAIYGYQKLHHLGDSLANIHFKKLKELIELNENQLKNLSGLSYSYLLLIDIKSLKGLSELKTEKLKVLSQLGTRVLDDFSHHPDKLEVIYSYGNDKLNQLKTHKHITHLRALNNITLERLKLFSSWEAKDIAKILHLSAMQINGITKGKLKEFIDKYEIDELEYLSKNFTTEQLNNLSCDNLKFLCENKLRPAHIENLTYSKLETLISTIPKEKFKHLFIFSSKQLNEVPVKKLNDLINQYTPEYDKQLTLLSSKQLTDLESNLLDKLIKSEHTSKLSKLTVEQIQTVCFDKLEELAETLSEVQFNRLAKLTSNELISKPVSELHNETKINFVVCFDIDETLIAQEKDIKENTFGKKCAPKVAKISPYNSSQYKENKVYTLFLEDYKKLFATILKNGGHIAFVTKGRQGNMPEFIKNHYDLDENSCSFYQVNRKYPINTADFHNDSTTETCDYILTKNQLVANKSAALADVLNSCGLSGQVKVAYLIDNDKNEISDICKSGYQGLLANTQKINVVDEEACGNFFSQMERNITNTQRSPFMQFFEDFLKGLETEFSSGLYSPDQS